MLSLGEAQERDIEGEKPSARPSSHGLSNARPGRIMLESYPSTDSLLDELLDDIRRSRTTSLASTPTTVSSDGENERAGTATRREDELRGMSVAELGEMAESLSQDVCCVSDLLVRLLHMRDKRVGRLLKHFDKLTAILRNYAEENGMDSDLKFSLQPPQSSEEDYQEWLMAWKALARLPKGIPKHWRKTLWVSLAEHSIKRLDWNAVSQVVFSEYSTPEDDSLGTQIVKDLHRTGNAGFTREEEHAVLKRVLLAYARFNKSTGYCQGFNIIAALILKVVDFSEEQALKVMVYLIDYILPENYFAQNLYALSADMAIFRDLLQHYLPDLSTHLEELRKEASGTVRTSYSSENPPDLQSIRGYEPPLADVFSMQWFLTIFATALPRKATRQVWDVILLEGSDVLIYTAIAILAVMERRLLQTTSAADFYTSMAQLGEKLRKAHILPSTEFLQVMYAVRECAKAPASTVPDIQNLRGKYTYNIYPCAQLVNLEDSSPSTGSGGGGRRSKRCPHPSRGGSFFFGGKGKETKADMAPREMVKESLTEDEEECVGKEDRSLQNCPIKVQVKKLHKQYMQVARQPTCISCDMTLAPPKARPVCPQTKKSTAPAEFTMSYAADVPPEVLWESRIRSGLDTVEAIQNRKQSFTISSVPTRRQAITCDSLYNNGYC